MSVPDLTIGDMNGRKGRGKEDDDDDNDEEIDGGGGLGGGREEREYEGG